MVGSPGFALPLSYEPMGIQRLANPIYRVKERCTSLLTAGSFWSGRWVSNPRPRPWQGRALPLSYARSGGAWTGMAQGAEGQNRTDDTSIFSAVLYQLSYLGRHCL